MMKNQNLQKAIYNYSITKTDYELYWELSFSPLEDIEEVAQKAWLLELPVPFLALSCRLCLEMSQNPERLREAFSFLNGHSDYGDDANLKVVLERLNLTFDSLSSEAR